MKISLEKLELVMARKCVTRESLRPVLPAGTLSRVRKGESVRPITVGKLANVLDIDVTEILEGG